MESLPLEEFVTCQICFEVYTEPQSLSCRHTLCRRCVRKLKRGSKIQCPMCNTFSDTKDIKPDFNTVSLIDLYKQQEAAMSEGSGVKSASRDCNPKVCNACKGADKEVTSLCEDCSQFMCSDCEAAHKGIPSLKNHSLKTLEQVSDDIKVTLTDTQVKLELKKDALMLKKESVETEVKKLDKMETNTIGRIDASEEAFVDQVVAHYDTLRTRVKQWKQEESDKLRVIEKLVNAGISDVADKMDTVTELIESTDPHMLIKNAHYTEDIAGTCLEADQHLPADQDIQRHYSIEVMESPGFDSRSAAQIDIINTDEEEMKSSRGTGSASHHTERAQYSDMTGTYENRKCVALDAPAKRLYNVKDYLWVIGTNVISVYNKHLQLVKTITMENVSNATAVIQMDQSNMLVTCSVKKALQVLDSNGKFEYTVTKGCFSDVVRYNHMIYVLDYNHCKIYVFRMVGGTLLPSKMFKLQYENGGEYDTMCIKDGTVYVASWFNHCVYKHAENGELVSKFGKSGSKTVGALKGPRLCGVDSAGNILVADCGNHRVQVYDLAAGVWRMVQIEESTNIGWPYDAIVGENIKYVWIVDFKSLIKLRKQEA